MNINEDFHAYLAQRGQELAVTQTAKQTSKQTSYERQERLAAEGGELFTGLFAQLDSNSQLTEQPDGDTHELPAADPAENDFNKFFGL